MILMICSKMICNILSKRRFKKGTLLGIYIVLYAIVRFTDEFFRGDLIRGHLLGLSPSQWISIVVFVIGTIILLKRYVLKGKDRFGYRVSKGEIPEGYTYNKYAGAISPWEQEKMARKQAAAAKAAGTEVSENEESADSSDTEAGSNNSEKTESEASDAESPEKDVPDAD